MKLAGQIIAAVTGLGVALVDAAFVGAMVSNGVFVIQTNVVGVFLWAAAIAVAGLLLLGSVVVPARHRAWMRGLAAILLAIIGIVGFFFFALILVGVPLAAIAAIFAIEPPQQEATQR